MSKHPTSDPVKNFIPYLENVLLIGERGAFKTSVAYALARCVASGKPFAGLPVGQRQVIWDSYDNLDPRDTAYHALTGQTSGITESSDLFQATADQDLLKPTLDYIAETAKIKPSGCLLVLDDIEQTAGATLATDRWLTSVMGTLTTNLRCNINLLVTLTATRDDLKDQYKNLARQFSTILEVERWGSEYWNLRVVSSKNAPEQFEVDGQVQFVLVETDMSGALRVPVAVPNDLLAHNARSF